MSSACPSRKTSQSLRTMARQWSKDLFQLVLIRIQRLFYAVEVYFGGLWCVVLSIRSSSMFTANLWTFVWRSVHSILLQGFLRGFVRFGICNGPVIDYCPFENGLHGVGGYRIYGSMLVCWKAVLELLRLRSSFTF